MTFPDIPTDQLCGQLIIAGFDGSSAPAELSTALVEGTRGGVILFKRNLPSLEVALELCRSVAESAPAELPPFIGVDQEGGRVSRLPKPFPKLPAMRVLGRIGDLELTRRASAAVAKALSAIGFNINFAPVLDVDSNPKNPVIGDRAFSSDSDEVARLGRYFIEGHRDGDLMTCAKHFPGHGDTDKDSHQDLPVVTHDKKRMDLVELPPFRAAAIQQVAAMMTAHVVYEEVDRGRPATLSSKICTELLRDEVGFRGVLFSDDLEMKALSEHYSIQDAAVGAIRAGCDALLICRDLDLQCRAHAALVETAGRDEAFLNRCREAATRALAVRRKHPPAPVDSPGELADRLADEESRQALAEVEERGAQLEA